MRNDDTEDLRILALTDGRTLRIVCNAQAAEFFADSLVQLSFQSELDHEHIYSWEGKHLEVANELEQAGWRLVSVVTYARVRVDPSPNTRFLSVISIDNGEGVLLEFNVEGGSVLATAVRYATQHLVQRKSCEESVEIAVCCGVEILREKEARVLLQNIVISVVKALEKQA